MTPTQNRRAEGWEVDLLRLEIEESGPEAAEIVRGDRDGDVDVPGELGGAVEDAGLAPHQKFPDLPPAED